MFLRTIRLISATLLLVLAATGISYKAAVHAGMHTTSTTTR